MNDYPVGPALSPIQETQRRRLERQKKYLLGQIEDINKVLGLFEKYPEMEELQDLLRRV